MNPTQLLLLLQMTDSAFPTGAFAHSGGLETYTQAEAVKTPETLAALIAVKLEAAASTDLIIVHTVMSAADHDWAVIEECDALCSASKVARETREASEKIGRRMLVSVLNILAAKPSGQDVGTPFLASVEKSPNSTDCLTRYQTAMTTGRCAGHHAVVHGLACAALGIDAQTALTAFGYGIAANQTAASLKLMSMGQTQAQAVLSAAGIMLAQAVEKSLRWTLDDHGTFTPGLDIRAMQHERLFRRLFIS